MGKMRASASILRSFLGKKRGFTVRAILTGVILGSILACSNVYLALKVGAFNGGSIPGAIIGSRLFSLWGGGNVLLETNVAHSIASAGANFSGAYFDSIPVAAQLGFMPSYAVMVAFLAFGGLIGISLTVLFRRYLIVEEQLPFPSGIATANTLKTIGDQNVGKKKMRMLLVGFILSALMVFLQSSIVGSVLPGAVDFTGKLPEGLMYGISLSPMLLAFGYIMGFKSAVGYFLGNILTGLVISPILLSRGIVTETDWAPVAKMIASPASGLLIGGTVFSMIVNYKSLLNSFKALANIKIKTSASDDSDRDLPVYIPLLVIGVCTVVLATIFQQYASFIFFPFIVLLAFLFALVAARTTGETGLCPTSLFVWISISIIGTIVTKNPGVIAFLAGIVAVSVGQASDSTNDLKTSYLIKSCPGTIEISEYLGMFAGALTAPLAFSVIVKAYGIFNEQFPVPFGMVAKDITESVAQGGTPFNTLTLAIGLVAGALMTILKLPALPTGLGMFAPLTFGTTVLLGGIIRKIVSRKGEEKEDDGVSFFSGVLAGEGVLGVIVAAVIVLVSQSAG